jgi:hypothetical protein
VEPDEWLKMAIFVNQQNLADEYRRHWYPRANPSPWTRCVLIRPPQSGGLAAAQPVLRSRAVLMQASRAFKGGAPSYRCRINPAYVRYAPATAGMIV